MLWLGIVPPSTTSQTENRAYVVSGTSPVRIDRQTAEHSAAPVENTRQGPTDRKSPWLDCALGQMRRERSTLSGPGQSLLARRPDPAAERLDPPASPVPQPARLHFTTQSSLVTWRAPVPILHDRACAGDANNDAPIAVG